MVPQPVSGGACLRDLVLGGLPLLRRIALAAERAGFERVLVAAPRPGDEAPLAGTPAALLPSEFVLPPGPRRVVLLADGVAPQAAWLRHLACMPVEPEHLHMDGAHAAVVEAPASPRWYARIARRLTLVPMRRLPITVGTCGVVAVKSLPTSPSSATDGVASAVRLPASARPK